MPKHYGYRGAKALELDFWLVIADNKDGLQRPGVRVSADYPQMKRNERAIGLKMKVPLALFETPTLKAEINIEDPGATNIQIDVPAVAEAVRDVIGMDVDIKVNGAGNG